MALRKTRPFHPLGTHHIRQLSLLSFIRNLTATKNLQDNTSAATLAPSESQNEEKSTISDATLENKPGIQPLVEQKQPSDPVEHDTSSSSAIAEIQASIAEKKEENSLSELHGSEIAKNQPEAGPGKEGPGKITTDTAGDKEKPFILNNEKSVVQQKPPKPVGQSNAVKPVPSGATEAREERQALSKELASPASQQTTPNSSTSDTSSPLSSSSEVLKDSLQPKEPEKLKSASIPPKTTVKTPSTTSGVAVAYPRKPFGVRANTAAGSYNESGSPSPQLSPNVNVKIASITDKPTKPATMSIQIRPWGTPTEEAEPKVKIPIVAVPSPTGKSVESGSPSTKGEQKVQVAKVQIPTRRGEGEIEKEANNNSSSEHLTINDQTVSSTLESSVTKSGTASGVKIVAAQIAASAQGNGVSKDGGSSLSQRSAEKKEKTPSEALDSSTGETDTFEKVTPVIDSATNVLPPTPTDPEAQSPLRRLNSPLRELINRFSNFAAAGKQRVAAQSQPEPSAITSKSEESTIDAEQPLKIGQVQKALHKAVELIETPHKQSVAVVASSKPTSAATEGEIKETKADAPGSAGSVSKAATGASPTPTPEAAQQSTLKPAAECAPVSAPESSPKPAVASAPGPVSGSEFSALMSEENPPAPLTKSQRKALRKAERAKIAEAKLAANRARQAESAAKAAAKAEGAKEKQEDKQSENDESRAGTSAAASASDQKGAAKPAEADEIQIKTAKETEERKEDWKETVEVAKAEKAKEDKAAAGKADAEKAANEAAAKAKAEKAANEAAAKAKVEKAANEAAAKAKAEKAANEAAAKAKVEKAANEAAAKAKAEKAANEAAAKAKAKEAARMAAEKARADKLAVDKAKAEKIAAEKAKAHQAAIQKAQAQKAAAEKAKAQRVAADKARGGQANGEKAAAAKVHEGQPGKAVTEDEDQFKDDSFVDKSLREQSRYYAVKYGFNPGIYYHWTDCQAQIEGYESPIFKAFDSLVEADQFMRAPGPKPWSPPLTKAKYYAVQQGKVPGVYTSWTEAREQVLDYPEPKYRKFNSFDEAEEFVKLNEAYIPPSGECDLTDEVPVASISGQAASPVAYQFQTCQNNNTVEIVTPAFTLRVTPHVEAPSVGGSAVAADRVLNRAAATPKPAEQVADKSSYTLPDQRVIAGSRKKEVPVSTDGACSGNGKVSGRAGIGVYFGPGDLRNIAEPLPGSRQTSARAELAAIARALELVRRDSNVAVFSDSKYAVNCLTNWYVGWQRNNWMTSDGRPVENKDIIQNILQKIEEREKLSASTRFEWVRGHNRNKWNEMADKLANDGVKKSFTLQ